MKHSHKVSENTWYSQIVLYNSFCHGQQILGAKIYGIAKQFFTIVSAMGSKYLEHILGAKYMV